MFTPLVEAQWKKLSLRETPTHAWNCSALLAASTLMISQPCMSIPRQ
jgi:hypothetical protein